MYKQVKRAFDIIFSTVALIILLPFWVPIIILLKFTGEGEVFYKQKRLGLNGEHFYVLKFATMLKNSPMMGTGLITVRNDPRVTPIGGFLRKTKINELPQILNVLIGDMSFVGPRPLVDETFDAYPLEMKDLIYREKPGVTGIGSVIFRDEEKYISESGMNPKVYYQRVIAPYKGELEIWYHEHINFWTDIKILLLTVISIIKPNNDLTHMWFHKLPKRSLAGQFHEDISE